MTTPLERFMDKTRRDAATGCLLWDGATTTGGAGKFWDGAAMVRAHRWIFEEKYGYAPDVVRQSCGIPTCVDWEKCLLPAERGDHIREVGRRRYMPDAACRNGHRGQWVAQRRDGKLIHRCGECDRLWAIDFRGRHPCS